MKPMYFNQLIERRSKLRGVIRRIDANLQNAPEDGLRICKSKGGLQFYRINSKGDTKGSYISKKDMDQIRMIAQADYERKVLKKARREIRQLNALIRTYESGVMESVLEDMNSNRIDLLSNRFLTDEEYAKKWQAQDYVRKPFAENDPEHYTDREERVRSKSEVIIANRLGARDVPRFYEFPLTVNGKIFYPDFTVLNVRTREVFIWEHLGKMDDPEYIADAMSRLAEYKKAGYYIGVNLIITFETADHPLNVKEIDAMIDRFLM